MSGRNCHVEDIGSPLSITTNMFGIKDNAFHIDDSSQCITGILDGKISTFSFYATKLMSTGGQGGMVMSRNTYHIEQIRDYMDFDMRRDDKARFNFNMSGIQAELGIHELKKLPSYIERRREIFGMYKEAGLDLIDGEDNVCYRAVMRTDKPQEIIKKLAENDIEAIVPINDWELLAQLPNALKLSRTTVSLPIYPTLEDAEVRKVINSLT